MSDIVLTLCVIGVFAFCIWRKKHKKKTEETEVQTSELATLPITAGALPYFPMSSGMSSTYPKGAQVEVLAFNFREFHSMEQLSASIDAKLNRVLMEMTNNDRVPLLQYIPVGTTLVVVCVHTL